MKHGFLALALLAMLFACNASLAGENAPDTNAVRWRQPSYAIVAQDMPVRDILNNFALVQQVNIVFSKDVDGLCSGNFSMPSEEFLDKFCAMNNLIWYFDGSALYIYRVGEIQTFLADLKYMKADELKGMLAELGVEDARYPLKTTSGDQLVKVSGPPRYVELVSEMITKADSLKQLRTYNEVEVRVFPLKNAWADDVDLDVDDDDVTIKGVATMLQELMNNNNGSKTKETTAKGAQGQDTAESTEGEDKLKNDMANSYKPFIQADNRLNAVVVRDVVSRMPMYEELIAALDVSVPLVEIEMTVLDISKENALDWELELKGALTRSNTTAGATQAGSNLTSISDLAGLGLAGSVMYLGHNYELQASLNALTQKGKAKTISRPTLLTMNNLAAELTDTRTYRARVVGQEVAEVETVTAGIQLKVKPHIVGQAGTPDCQIWLTVELEDGGFEAVAVDGMPMTSNSTIETQAAVYEGQSLLIGGYMRDIDEDHSWGIPLLRDIPYIGWIFGGYSNDKSTMQRMFVLTPHVINLDDPKLHVIQAARQHDQTVPNEIADELDYRDDEQEDLRKDQKEELQKRKDQRREMRKEAQEKQEAQEEQEEQEAQEEQEKQ